MDNTIQRKVFIILSIVITASFLSIGIFWCTNSYLRLWETLKELWESIIYYFCEIFAIEQSVPETGPVIPPSEVLDPEVTTPILPNDSSYFWLKFKAYFNLFIQGDNLKRYFVGILRVIGDISQILLLVIPLILLFVILIKKIYGARNTNYNQDTKPLKAFKAISGVTYQPVKRFILSYQDFLTEFSYWKTMWLWIWLVNINFVSMVISFIAFYFYFAISFDLTAIIHK